MATLYEYSDCCYFHGIYKNILNWGRGTDTRAEPSMFVCLFVLSRTSNFSAIWRLSQLPVTGLQI
jgi:hypothetical protein